MLYGILVGDHVGIYANRLHAYFQALNRKPLLPSSMALLFLCSYKQVCKQER